MKMRGGFPWIISVAAFCALLFPACATDPFYAPGIPYPVEIITEPPGARIEFENDYVGNAPCTINVMGDQARMNKRWVLIRALPSESGQSVQEKILGSGPIPHRILFNMNLGTTTPDVNININEY